MTDEIKKALADFAYADDSNGYIIMTFDKEATRVGLHGYPEDIMNNLALNMVRDETVMDTVLGSVECYNTIKHLIPKTKPNDDGNERD